MSNENNRRIVKNTIALCVRMLITIAIGIYTSRIILSSLGVIDYGIYNVVSGIVSMFSFLNTSMTDATQRYLNFYIGNGDKEKLNEIFGTSLTIFMLLAIVVFILCETLGLYFLYTKLSIPEERINAAFWILQISSISSLINISSIPYNAIIISYEKMTTFAYVSIYQSAAILIVSLGINYMFGDKLIIYGLLLMLVHISIRLFYRHYCAIMFSEIQNKYCVSKHMFKELISFSGWTLSSTFAYMTYNQGINIMMNILYGPAINAAQALANQINGNLTMFSLNFTIASKPQITKYYSDGKITEMQRLVCLSSKVSFIIFLIIALPFTVYGEYLLSLWLKEVPKYTNDFLQIIIIIALIGTLSSPIITAVHATGQIRGFQLTITAISLLILPLAYFVNLKTSNPIFTYYTLLVMNIFMQIGRLFFYKHMLHCSLIDYFKSIIVRLLVVAILSTLIVKCIALLLYDSLLCFIIMCIFSTIFVLLFSLLFGLSKSERISIFTVINNKILKRLK